MGRLDMMKSASLGNLIFDGETVRKGYLRTRGDRVVEVCDGEPSGGQKGVILPSFVNAHTHIGDSFAYPAPKLSLERLVAPQGGYKHRALTSASSEVKRKGMLQSLEIMSSSGTSMFADFREEGLEGVKMLLGVLRQDHPKAVILGRPLAKGSSSEDLNDLLAASDGIGMSAVSDYPLDLLKKVSDAAKAKGKLFSVHFSEGVREDVEAALSMRPDFVIHATMATRDDLEALAAAKVPVVVCPRSNEFFGKRADIPAMLASGVEIGVGTDNGMICLPDMIEEVKAVYRISGASGGITPEDAIRMSTVQGRKLLRAEGNTTSTAENEHDFTIVRVPGRDPLKELVTSAKSVDVLATVRGGKVRRSASWR